jgi:hypothetical protein
MTNISFQFYQEKQNKLHSAMQVDKKIPQQPKPRTPGP